jgi:dolichol-phosphate mannosyltransferase
MSKLDIDTDNRETPALSVIIPCYNEESCISETIKNIISEMYSEKINFEILCINNNSSDKTEKILFDFSNSNPKVRYLNTDEEVGYGIAVKRGLESFAGQSAVIVMADGSENPSEIVGLYRKLAEGYDCAFGDRFSDKDKLINYPKFKYILNRVGNRAIAWSVNSNFTDLTYGFKCFRREVLQSVGPLIARDFNINLELFLKVHYAQASIAKVNTSWKERSTGVSKFKLYRQSVMNIQTFLTIIYIRKFKFRITQPSTLN